MADAGFILVHGGAHDARCWSRLVPHLDGPALAVDLPGRGSHPGDLSALTSADFVESAVADLDAFTEAERVVLVGHSMAGITLPGVVARRPDRVARVVFVSCFVPREGSTIMADMPAPMRVMAAVLAFRHRLRRRSPQQLQLSSFVAKRGFCSDMDGEQTAFTLSVLVPEVEGIVYERVSRADMPGPDVVPRTFVKLLRDRSLPPKLQDRLIANLGDCDVRTIDAGHDVMISRPAELASVLNEIRLAV